MIPTATIFISSPGDVNEERVITAQVIQRLNEEFSHRVTLNPIFWEHEPMLMTESFQTQIQAPSETQIFLGILWSRMGTRLPANISRADGSRYQSGTEYEFEDAWQSYKNINQPEILIYRKTAKPLFNPDASDFEDRVKQKKNLDVFFQRWFQDDDGSFIAAFNPFTDLSEFEERVEIHLRKLLNRLYPILGNKAEPQRHITWQQGSPFRGLSVFEADHSSIFFGRTRAISEILTSLRKAAQENHAFTMILGTSGSGKSSLVRAGVLPLLIQPGVIEGVGAWQYCIFRPSDGGHELVQKLAQKLLSCDGLLPENQQNDHDELASLLQQVGNPPKDYIGRTQHLPYASLCKNLQNFINQRLNKRVEKKGLKKGQIHLALVIDQWEEIYTLEYISPQLRYLFINIIAVLARLDNVWVIATCRSDFYHRCTEQAALVALMKQHGQYMLMPPNASEITQMICAPALAAGLSYGQDQESLEQLDDLLLNTMVKHPNNLALLQFTLDALYQRRTQNNVLSYQIYQEMGGIEGALAQRAEAVFRQLSFAAQAAFPALMRTLITIKASDDSPIAGRRMLLDNDQVSSALQEILDAYINARLLVTDRDSGGTAVARLAHDALINHWSRLKTWIEEERHLLRVRVRTKEAARHWIDEGRPTELLLNEGHTLSQAEELLHQWHDSIDKFVTNYIETSLKTVNQQRENDKQQQQYRLQRSRKLNTVLSSLFMIAMLGASYGLYASYLATESARQAHIAKQQVENALNLAKRNSQSAYRQAKRANTIAEMARQERNKALRSQSLYLSALAKQEIKQGDAVTAALLALRGLPQDIVTPERPYMPQAEQQLQSALQQQREYAVLSGHKAAVKQAIFSPDSQQVVTISADHQVRLWDSYTGKLIRVLEGHNQAIWSVEFSPDGQQIITASLDKSVIIWNKDNGKKQFVFQGHHAGLSNAKYSPDGSQIVSADLDGHVYFWDSTTGLSLKTIHTHNDRVTSLVFSDNGQYMLTTSRDRSASLWNVSNNKRLYRLEGHQRDINAADFSKDGDYIVTASDDKSAFIWDIKTGQVQHQLTGHIREVQKAIFSPDSQYVVTASKDHRIGVWKRDTGERLYWLQGHQHGINDIVFNPQNSDELISVARDGSIILWSLKRGEILKRFAGHEASINSVNFSADGRLLVTAADDNSARLWQINPLTQIGVIQASKGLLKLTANGQEVWGSIGHELKHWYSQDAELMSSESAGIEAITHIVYHPDNNKILCSSASHLKLWDAKVQQWMILKELNANTKITGFSADGRYIFAANQTQALLWHYDGRLINKLDDIKSATIGFSFSKDNQYLATAHQDGRIALWRLPDGLLLTKWQANNSNGLLAIKFHAHNKQLLSLSHTENARLWHIPTGKLNITYDANHISSAIFSHKGDVLATNNENGQIILWDTYTGIEKSRLKGHKERVARLQFSQDDQRLLSIAADGIQLWDLDNYVDIMQLKHSIYAPETAQISDDMQTVLSFDSSTKAVLWRIFPDINTLVEHAKQVLPRSLSATQKQAFFLE